MSFDWVNYLDVATHLHDNLSTEASFRSGVSRSYYSVFGRAKLFCLEKKLISQRDSTTSSVHTLIPIKLRETEIEELFEIAIRYEALKERRISADYNPFDSAYYNQKYLQDTIIKAREVINLLKEY